MDPAIITRLRSKGRPGRSALDAAGFGSQLKGVGGPLPAVPAADDPRWSELEDGLREALDKRLTLAFLGSASSGKDSAIKALFGVDFGEISPIPGSTDRLRVVSLDGEDRFLLVNAPGFGDIRPEVDALARKAMESLDLVIYLVNCEGGATAQERGDLDAIRRRGAGKWPTLVCLNKIDLIRPNQREDFVARTLSQLGLQPGEAVLCAFDPLPALSREPIGLDELVGRIDTLLRERGKELAFAKILRDRRLACQPLIARAARRAAIAGAVPLPGADITAITWVQVDLVERIAAVHGQRLDREVVFWLVGELLASGSKGFIQWAIQALKTAGWLPGAQVAQAATSALAGAVAMATTHAMGEVAIRFVQSEQRLTVSELRAVFDAVAFRYAPQGAGP